MTPWSVHEFVMTGFANLNEFAVGAGHVEDRCELAIATRFLVVAPADPVTVKFSEHKDWGGHHECHPELCSKSAVAVLHEEVDEALGLVRVLVLGL